MVSFDSMVTRKTQQIGIRVEPTIARWLKSIEKKTGRGVADLVRDLLWDSYQSTQNIEIQMKKHRQDISSIEEFIVRIGDFLSVPQNRTQLANELFSVVSFLENRKLRLENLFGSVSMGQKRVRKRKPGESESKGEGEK